MKSKKRTAARFGPEPEDTCDQEVLHHHHHHHPERPPRFYNLRVLFSPLLALYSVLGLVVSGLCSLLAWFFKPICGVMATKPKQADGEDCDATGDLIKKHHKQAFEFISVALRIDEDEKGNTFKGATADRFLSLICTNNQEDIYNMVQKYRINP